MKVRIIEYFVYMLLFGQKRSTIAQLVETLRKEGALSNVVVVVASASEPASFSVYCSICCLYYR